MARTCGVCSHPARDELERRHREEGAGPRVLAKLTETELKPPVDKDVFTRHFENAKKSGCATDPRRADEGEEENEDDRTKARKPQVVDGWRLDQLGRIVSVEDSRDILLPFDERYLEVSRALGLGAYIESLSPGPPGAVGDEELSISIEGEVARLTAEAATLETAPGVYVAGRGARLTWVDTLRSWKAALGRLREELQLLRDLDQRGIPTSDWVGGDWRRIVRERVQLLTRHVHAAEAERQQRECDPLDVEAEELQKQIGALALAVEDGDADAAFKLVEIEKKLAAIEAKRRRKIEAETERQRRRREREETERREKLVSAKTRLAALASEQEAHRGTLMRALVALCDAVATDVFLSAERHDASMAVARFNGGSGGHVHVVREREALANLVHHALASRGQLSSSFHLAWRAEGQLFDMWAAACGEADLRRDVEQVAEDPEWEATRLEALKRDEKTEGREEAAES